MPTLLKLKSPGVGSGSLMSQSAQRQSVEKESSTAVPAVGILSIPLGTQSPLRHGKVTMSMQLGSTGVAKRQALPQGAGPARSRRQEPLARSLSLPPLQSR
jgi:hypothetical protein